jgi:hypothetical protein
MFECLVQPSGSGLASVAVSCEHDNKLSYSMKGGEFYDSWAAVRFLTEDSALRSYVMN